MVSLINVKFFVLSMIPIENSIRSERPDIFKILFLVYFAFWDRFSFYGVFTELVLYLTSVAHLSETSTYSLWGIYAILGYALPVVAGIVSDRWLDQRRGISYGLIGLFLSALTLIIFKDHGFALGLALLLCGSGILKTNLSTFVGNLLSERKTQKRADGKKDGAYTLYFTGMVSGATMGPAFFGFFVAEKLWYGGFYVILLGVLSALGLSLFLFKPSFMNLFRRYKRFLLEGSLAILSVALVALSFVFANHSQYLLVVFLIVVITYLIVQAMKTPADERLKITYLIALSFLCIPYLLGALQVDGSFNLFIQNHLNHTLFGWEIPTLEFSALEPLVGALCSPFLGWLWITLDQKYGFSIAANNKVLMGVGFSILAYLTLLFLSSSQSIAGSDYASLGMMLSNVFIGLSGILIIPTMMSSINQFAPPKLKGTLMGFWFLGDALAGWLAGFVSKSSNINNEVMAPLSGFHHSFWITFVLLLISGGVLVAGTTVFKKMIVI